MAQDTTPSIIMYQGGTDKFPVPFDKGYYGEVKVLFVRRGATGYEHEPASSNYVVNGRLYAWGAGSNYIYTHTPMPAIKAHVYNDQDVDSGKMVEATAGQTITVDGVSYIRATQHDISNHLILTWIGEELGVDDYICIGRDTERGQPYSLPNNQKHIEGALDNIERQVQELKDKTDNALVVDPTHTIDASKMGPIDWLETIVRSTDKTARSIRYHNGYLQFSLEDPDVPLDQKTWTSVLNTINITTVREWYDEEKNEYHFLYSKNNGVTWRELPLYDAVHGFEKRLATVENEQVVLKTGVKGNADAILKTREDFASADQAIRADMNAKDSELETILNDHTERLDTLRTDHDDLGDDVSDIQAKIPESASGTNPLVTKADLGDSFVKKTGDTITGDLVFDVVARADIIFQDSSSDVNTGNINSVRKFISAPHQTQGFIFSEIKNGENKMQFSMVTDGLFMPYGNRLLGSSLYPWENIYAKKLNNGADIAIPTEGGTLARLEDLIDLRADINEADSELQTQITAQAAEIATKQDQLIAGDNITIVDNVISATGGGGGGGGIANVIHDATLTGSGTNASPLGLAEAIKDEIADKAPKETVEALTTSVSDIMLNYLPKSGGTITGSITLGMTGDPYSNVDVLKSSSGASLVTGMIESGSVSTLAIRTPLTIFKELLPLADVGQSFSKVPRIYVEKINNGADISIPTTGGTMALAENVATAIADAVANIDALPDQTGNAGKVLMTDGESASWQEAPASGTKVIIKRYN